MKATALPVPDADNDVTDAAAPLAARQIVVGLIGSSIGGSRSPALHEHEGRALGLDYAYRLIDLDAMGLTPSALPQLIERVRRAGFAGLNITHPCKQLVLPLLDELSADAARLGAVNTVVFGRDGRSIGHNTDWIGFARSFCRELGDRPRRRVVQLGAGGAGAAVAHALLALGVEELALIDTEGARAVRLAAALAERFGTGRALAPTDAAVVGAADGLVNTTPVGLAKHPGLPLDAALLRPALWVRHRLLSARDRVAPRCARARLSHHGRRRHGGVPSGGRLPPLHGVRARYRAHAPPFRELLRRR